MFLFPFDFQWFVCGMPACGFLCIYIARGSLSCLNLCIDAFHQIRGIPGPTSFLWVLCVPHAFSSRPALLTVTRGSDSDASSAPFPGFCLPLHPAVTDSLLTAFDIIGSVFCVQIAVKLACFVQWFSPGLEIVCVVVLGVGIVTSSCFKWLQASLHSLFLCESILAGFPFIWGLEGQLGWTRTLDRRVFSRTLSLMLPAFCHHCS